MKKQEYSSPKKFIFVTTLANGLEFFDLIVYVYFSAYITDAYFPSSDRAVGLMISFLVFGVGYLARPLGAMVIGHYADLHGRKPAMAVTFILMGISTLLIGIMPSYQTIGITAPIVITLARFFQGFSAGGEMGASTTLLVECAKDHNRGFYASWQVSGQGAGTLFSALTLVILLWFFTENGVHDWGWRVPFIIGAIIAPIGWYIRTQLHDTAQFVINKENSVVEQNGSIPLVKMCRYYYKEMLSGILMSIGGTVPNIIIMFYIPVYAVQIIQMDQSYVMSIGALGGLITMIGAPFVGVISDKVGRKKLIMYSRLGIALLIYPAFFLLNSFPRIETLIVIISILSVVNVIGAVPSITLLPELFPRSLRSTGLSVTYSISAGIFGGFSLSTAFYLSKITSNAVVPAYYVMFVALISLLSFFYIKETGKKPLLL